MFPKPLLIRLANGFGSPAMRCYHVLDFGSIAQGALISRLTNRLFFKSEHSWKGLKPVYMTYSNIMMLPTARLRWLAAAVGMEVVGF